MVLRVQVELPMLRVLLVYLGQRVIQVQLDLVMLLVLLVLRVQRVGLVILAQLGLLTLLVKLGHKDHKGSLVTRVLVT